MIDLRWWSLIGLWLLLVLGLGLVYFWERRTRDLGEELDQLDRED